MASGARLVLGVAALMTASAAGAALGSQGDRSARSEAVPLPEDPRRIVSANLPSDEVLLALGVTDRIVALSAFADDPAISNVREDSTGVAARVRGDAETILALDPDLVLAFPFGQAETEALLRQGGIPLVHVPGAMSLEDVRTNIRTIASAVGRAADGERLIDGMDVTLKRVARATEGAQRPRVLLWHAMGTTAGAGTVFDEVLSIAGGTNVAAEAGLEGNPTMPVELALAADPEVIFVVDYRGDARERRVAPRELLGSDDLFGHVSAVREGRVHALTPRFALSTTHHVARAAVEMASILHPDRVAPQPLQKAAP